MRSGGPRLLCSPYFVIALFIVVILLSMKYYSISSENDTLLLRIEVLQNQMKMTGSNLKSLDSTLARKNEALLECNNDKIRAEEKSKKLDDDNQHKEGLISRLKDEINNKKSEMEKLKTENVNLYLANDTITDVIKKLNEDNEALKSRNEKLEADLQDLASLQQRNAELEDMLNQAQESLVNFGADKIPGKDDVHVKGPVDQGPRHPQDPNDAQLPDVDPDAVHIRQPALHGDHAKEESVVHEVKVERANGDFQDEEGELLDKARDIPDIRKKSDKEGETNDDIEIEDIPLKENVKKEAEENVDEDRMDDEDSEQFHQIPVKMEK